MHEVITKIAAVAARGYLVHDEQGLVERARAGDTGAFARLYEDYFDRVYRYIAIRVGSRVEAEDLTEQVFLKALESIGSFQWRGVPFSSWLFRIAHNQVVDYLRKATKRESLPLDESVVAGGLDPGLGGSVFAQQGAEQIGDLPPNEGPYVCMIGKILSLEDGVLTLETRRGEVSLILTEDTKYGIPGRGEVTAEEFEAYVGEALANDEVVRAGVRAVEQDDGTLVALGIRVMPRPHRILSIPELTITGVDEAGNVITIEMPQGLTLRIPMRRLARRLHRPGLVNILNILMNNLGQVELLEGGAE